MLALIKKNWITSLGVFFIFMAFLYFLKTAIDLNWIPPAGRAAIGLGIGVSCLFAGYSLRLKQKGTWSQIISGLGVGFMYATFTYTSFSESIQWSANTMFISTLALSGLVGYISYKYNMRILIFISLLAGLFSPIILKAQLEQVTLLFLYVTMLNIASLYVSVRKGWTELRIMSFVSTLIIYVTYYVFFEPESWGHPMFYATALFVVYMVGSVMASWFEKDKFVGLNLYIGLINAINFIFWSIFIFSNFTLSYTIPTIITGVTFIGAGVTIYFLSNKSIIPSVAYFALGVILLAISGGDIGIIEFANGMNHVYSTLIWITLVAAIFAASKFTKHKEFMPISIVAWSIVLIHWFSVAWNVEWVRWFGVEYIPFINPGAIIWMLLAGIGFYFSEEFKKINKHFSTAFAIIAHIVVGGLFTVQIQNLWEAYEISKINLQLTQSIAWGMYAMCIFLWGAHTKSKVFRILGSIVLLVTSVKIFIFDLSGNATIYKAAFLFVMGMIVLAIAYINKRWSHTEKEEVTVTNNI